MEVGELRIGSIYHSVKFNKPVQQDAFDISELVKKADGADISDYISEMFGPIPLTEEWLNKTDIEWHSNYRITIGGWLELESLHEDDSWSFYINGRLIKIEYLHQLQNVYAISGEELIIK